MSETNGWPGKPGVPLNPERDGWHWVKTGHGLSLWRWEENSESIMWDYGWETADGLLSAANFAAMEPCIYLGPCLTPAEVEARVKEARRDALEEAALWDEGQAHHMRQMALKGEGDDCPHPRRATGKGGKP